MVERPILTASGEVLYGETPEDGIIAKFYGDPDLAKVAAQSVNAFAALAEHLDRDPADLQIDLVGLVEALQNAKNALVLTADWLEDEAGIANNDFPLFRGTIEGIRNDIAKARQALAKLPERKSS